MTNIDCAIMTKKVKRHFWSHNIKSKSQRIFSSRDVFIFFSFIALMPDTGEEKPLQHQQSQSYQTIILPSNDDDDSNDKNGHLMSSSYNSPQHKLELGNISLPILTLWYVRSSIIMLVNQPGYWIT